MEMLEIKIAASLTSSKEFMNKHLRFIVLNKQTVLNEWTFQTKNTEKLNMNN